jgi:hypothetical protein
VSERTGARSGAGVDGIGRLLAEATEILSDAIRRVTALQGATIAAIGWATVAAERAERELGGVLDEPGRWEAAPRDELLGATVRLWRGEDGEPPLLLVLEPDREGHLAAALARHGEGIAAIYITGAAETAFTAGLLPRPASGPLGPARRLAGGSLGDASIIVLAQDSAP